MRGLFANQVLREIREHRLLIPAWWGVLLAVLVHGVGTTEVLFDADGGYQWGGGLWSFFVLALIGVGALLPALMGVADSPANSRGFLHTRPVARATVWGAKVAVLGLVMVLPVALVSMVTVAVRGGGDAGFAVRAACDRLAFVVPAVVFFLCWGGLCGRVARLVGFTLAGVLMVSGLLLGTGVAFQLAGRRDLEMALEEPGSLPIRLLLIFVAGALVAVAALVHGMRRRDGRGRPAWVALVVAVVAAAVFALPGMNLLRPGGEVPGPVASALAGVRVRLDPYSVKTWRDTTQWSEGEAWHLASDWVVEGVPDGLVLGPSVQSAVLRGADGEAWRFDRPAGAERWRTEVRLSESDLAVIAEVAGGGVMIHRGHSVSGFRGGRSAMMHWPVDGGLGERSHEPLDLEVELASACLAVQEIARVPLRDGAAAETATGGLTLMRPRQEPWEAPTFALRFRHPQLWLTRDEALRFRDGWQLGGRIVCLLVHPEREAALLCDFAGGFTPRGLLAGLPETVLVFRHEPGEFGDLFDRGFLEEAEARVMRVDWIGEHPSVASLAGVRLDHRETRASGFGSRPLEPAAYARAVERLGAVGEAVDSEDVRATLEVIDRRSGGPWDAGDPGFRRLVEIGRRDLALLVEAVTGPPGPSRDLLVGAIDTLAGEGDRGMIIAALRDAPDLAGVVVRRGWVREAGEVLVALARERRPLPPDALTALVLLGDPETHPLLLDHFAHLPGPWAYDLLWRIPELRPELERIVAERWDATRRVVADDNLASREDLRLALRIGRKDALDFVLRALRGGDTYGAVQALRPVMLLPQRTDRAGRELDDATSHDFEFDPRRRAFLPVGKRAGGGGQPSDPS